MSKTYISSLLAVFVAGTQMVHAQESLDDVFAQLDSAQGTQPASVAVVESVGVIDEGDAVVVESGVAAESAAPVAVAQEAEVTVSDDLFSKGVALYHAGEYDQAEAVFEAMLSEDTYDRRAMTYLQRTAQRISANEVRKQSATRSQAMSEVNAAWNPEPTSTAASVTASSEKPKSEKQLAEEAMEARLKGIVIPSLDFRDANIKDVVLFLTETCRRLDENGEGVNILLLGMDDSMAADQNNITISIRDMNLYEALQYIVEMASLKFEVKSKAVAVSPVNYVAEVDMVLKSFDVIPEVGSEMESMSGGDSGGGADDLFGDASSSASAGPANVQGFFSIVDWPTGSSAVYQPNFSKLFVKNTPKNITSISDILADLEDEAIKKRSQQVEIEAKFVEFNEGAQQELGFDWTVYGSGSVGDWNFSDDQTYFQPANGWSTPGTDVQGGTIYTDPVSGQQVITPKYQNDGSTRPGQSVFAGAQRTASTAFETLQSGILSTMGGDPSSMFFSSDNVDLEISALEQEGTADVLSAPKVTTKSGTEAIIRVVEVHRYPQDYDVETGQRTAPVVKPQDWESYDLGVVLKVQPMVDPESNTIDLQLSPTIMKFKGWDQYKVGSNAYESGGNNQSELFGDGSALIAKMPFFETRSIETEVTVADGSTVVMGGLVDERSETFRDQVPFLGDLPYLGRFFRTEGSRSSKKNLVIYVKATMVDDHGMTRSQRELARQATAN
ncbi:type II and III secretion system protein [Pontiella sulfatireligans]|uniref:Type II secretion system protein D n=1 Tax=Pontiella sulfatireligans TaxID=2750658 RepID=A0A6C2URM9_9BACT|nr:type II and III secretion system protein [Pontiella sulfatireligans]VGO21586.1 Type II secretion system protein D [Pontiella sulfatireligans]